MFWDTKAFDYCGWIGRLRHFFLGTSLLTGEPILLADDILAEHTWVTGSSGSRKLVP